MWPRIENYPTNYRDVVRCTVVDSRNNEHVRAAQLQKAGHQGYKKEDDALKDAVEEHVAKNWKSISNQLPGRSEVHRR